jgi:hypothetical protein
MVHKNSDLKIPNLSSLSAEETHYWLLYKYTLLLTAAESSLRIWQMLSCLRNTPPFREPEVLLLCSQQCATWPYHKRFTLDPRTGHVRPEGEQRYSSTLSLTLALNGERVVNTTPRVLYPWETDLIPMVQEARWATEPVGAGVEYLTSMAIWCPAHRKSLYLTTLSHSPSWPYPKPKTRNPKSHT